MTALLALNQSPDIVPPPANDAVEVDEVWSFIKNKGQQAWVWIAVSYQTRQVPAMVVGGW